MSKFKACDTVVINDDISNSMNHFGDAEEMYDMRGRAYPVLKSDGPEVIIEGFSFHEDDLTPYETSSEYLKHWNDRFDELEARMDKPSFVQSLVSGKLIHNPVEGGIDNGQFIGYAVELETDDEDGNMVKTHVIVNAAGKSVANINLIHVYSNEFYVQFELQPEKKITTLHTVAFNYGNRWEMSEFTDAELSECKHSFKRYKIIETRNE